MNSSDECFVAALRNRLEAKGRGAKKDLAARVGISPNHLSDILGKRKNAGQNLKERISAALGYTYEEMLALGRFILGGHSDDEIEQMLATLRGRLASTDPNLPSGPEFRTSVPLISWTQAGEWTGRDDPAYSDDHEEWVSTLSRVGPDAFALRVEDDLMEPEFREGDIIVVDPAREPVSGSFVIARVDDGPDGNGGTTLKQLVKDGGCVYLKPLNYRYPIMDMTGRKFRTVGVVVEKRKEYV